MRKKKAITEKNPAVQPENPRKIWALVLAAGESRRMGEPKLLLPFGGSTIIETVLQLIVDSRIDETMVVLGSEKTALEAQIDGFDVETVVNEAYELGMLSSVQAGVKALPESAEAFLIFLGDQPMIPVKVIDDLIEAYRMSGNGIVLPVFREKKGHPVLIAATYREEIFTLFSEIGLRELMDRHADDVLHLPVESAAVCRDIDDPEDYRREIQEDSPTS